MFGIGGVGMLVAGIMEWVLGNTFPFVSLHILLHDCCEILNEIVSSCFLVSYVLEPI
jgi:hypothetical protein